MPYLSFDLDALRRVPKVAAAAGVEAGLICYGLLQLWEEAWRSKKTTATFTHLRAFFPGAKPDALADALELFGFVEKQGPSTFRIRGAERYLRISKARSEGGKKASGNLLRGRKAAGDTTGAQPGTLPAQAGEEPEKSPGSYSEHSNSEHSNSEHSTTTGGGGEVDDAAFFPPTADGAWAFIQFMREERGRARELQRPTGFAEWHAKAMREVGLDGVNWAITRYFADAHFADRDWATAVFISDGVWPHRSAPPPERRKRL